MSYNTALSFADLDYSDIQVDISKFLFAYLGFPQSRFSLEKRYLVRSGTSSDSPKSRKRPARI